MTVTSFRYISDTQDEEAAALPEAGAADRAAAKGETVEELLLNLHGITVNPAKTMTDGIAAAQAGENTAFARPADAPSSPERALFYAVKVHPTAGEGRTARQEGNVIPGLYAAGEICSRCQWNENCIPAASLSLHFIMERRACASTRIPGQSKKHLRCTVNNAMKYILPEVYKRREKTEKRERQKSEKGENRHMQS